MALKHLPQVERLLSGVLQALLSDSAMSMTISNPPTKYPCYLEIEPGSDNAETVKAISVAGNIVTLAERGVYNGGVGSEHIQNSTWKQKWSSAAVSDIVDAIENGFLMEDGSLTVTRNSATEFQIEGINNSAFYTKGRAVRMNGSDIGIVLSSTYGSGNTVVTLSSGTVPNPLTSVEVAIGPSNAFGTVFPETVYDSNGNEILKGETTASAVNEITIKNAATGTSPELKPTGGDTNVGLDVKMKGSGVYRRPITLIIPVVASDSDVETGDGKMIFTIPPEINGMNLVSVAAQVYTAGTTNTLDIQIRNKTDSQDMLSTKITIDSTEVSSATAATAAAINTSYDDVVTDDMISIDIDATQTTKPKGLVVRLGFALP